MPDERYDAGRRTIGTLLSTTSPRIEVPEWQRSYSWASAEIEAFWLDLLAFDEAYPGNNITNEEYFLGSAVLVTGGATNLLLDGQQRLATATILLSVLRDARVKWKKDAATRLQGKYIADFDDASDVTTPVLTMNVYDKDYYRAEVQDERYDGQSRPAAKLKSHGLIRKARDYFSEKIAEQESAAGGGQDGFNRNTRIGKVLCDHMSVVVVTSTDEDNAAAVFETLNDRGIGLSTPDLLRNLLLRRASGPDARQRIVAAWQVILGIADEASVEDFIRHYWVSERGDVKARKLYREIKTTILAENVDSVEFSLALAESAPIYREIVRGRDADKELQRLLLGLRALGAKVSYPVLLSGYAMLDEGEDKADLRRLAEALTALIVRYSVIGGKESTTLESTIYKAAAALRTDQDIDTAVTAFQNLAPGAPAFIAAFRRASVARIATARYLLREIEQEMRFTEEMSVEDTDRVHVEHIYPQTPDAARWPNHAQVLNRLGNLSLLSRKLNTSIKNADFATKKKKAYATSEILMTKALMDYDDWSTDTINKRQIEMSKSVAAIWGFPGEHIPEPSGEAETAEDQPDSGILDAQALDELPEVPDDEQSESSESS
ncbi:DUF262 domain-containing protein [Nocardioides lentus]|uniref:DUF262 domain-containing protein n=1 Tax=Nocardioides lentus TaxID=338077 RepID=A0ABP5AJ91_9ACTN